MHIVRIALHGSQFSDDISEIQQWIKQIGFTVQRFDYELDDCGKLVSVGVGFLSPEEADIFSTQFGGQPLFP